MSDFADYFASLSPAEQEAVLNGPALQPPDGIVSNFEDPPNRNSMSFAVLTVGLTISAIFVFIRAYARIFCLKKVYLEDGLVLAAFGLYVAYEVQCYRLIDLTGLFVHQWDIQFKTTMPFEYIIYIGSNFAGSALMCIRAAILLDWIRIFVPAGFRNKFYWTSHVLLWLIVLFYISLKFAENLTCIPRQKIWDKTVQGGHCIDQNKLIIASAVVNLMADTVILALPQMVIWKLKLSTTKKVGISIVFATGLLNCIVACIRIATSVKYLSASDATYSVGTVILASHAEMTLLFLVACVPVVPMAVQGFKLPTIFYTLKSWATNSGKTGQEETVGISVQEHNQRPAEKPGPYSHLDERSLDTTETADEPVEMSASGRSPCEVPTEVYIAHRNMEEAAGQNDPSLIDQYHYPWNGSSEQHHGNPSQIRSQV